MRKRTLWNALFILALIFLISISGIVFYFNHNIKMMTQDYEAKISGLNQKIAVSLKSFDNKLSIISGNISLQVQFLNENLQNFKKQNQMQINTLSQLVDQIEQQSSIRLNELRDELQSVRVQSADFSAIVDEVLQSVVSVKTNRGQGSGAIIDKNGYIVTNLHVISDASTVRIVAYSGSTYNVDEIIGYDSNADIAVLKISAPNLVALNFGDSDDVRIGERVIAAGNPAGLAFTITEGIVSATRTASNNINYIQTDVPINPGNSGGPLINIKGEIIGINNFKVGGFEGLGFAISSNDVKSRVIKIIGDYEATKNQ